MNDLVLQSYAAYGQAFNEFAPTLYMLDLPEEEQIALLQAAIASGKPIDPESLEPKDMGEGDTFY